MNVLTEIARGVLFLLLAIGVSRHKPQNKYWKELGRCNVKLLYAVPGEPDKGYKMLTIDNRHQAITIQLDTATQIKWR